MLTVYLPSFLAVCRGARDVLVADQTGVPHATAEPNAEDEMAPCFQRRICSPCRLPLCRSGACIFQIFTHHCVPDGGVESSHSRRSPNRTYQKLGTATLQPANISRTVEGGSRAIPVRRGACQAESKPQPPHLFHQKATSCCTYAPRPDNSRMGLKQQVLSLHRRYYAVLLLTYDRLV
jgi:hypothetical protein